MSLFKARDWWQIQCGHGEEFDMYCLLVANIDNDPSGQAKIVTGSFSGILRVYLPRERGYRAEDLLLEAELEGGPVLALAGGRFTPAGGLQLAVLHPRKLTVYSVASGGGGSFLSVHKLYEHWLEHTAANMTYGPFGGVQGSDFICVQSYDGQVSFFEAEALAFARYLPNFLVPGPLAYVEASDSFITCSAALELEAYKYKVLAAASPDKQAPAMAGGKDGAPAAAPAQKRLQADWRVVLGEAAIDIRVGRYSQGLANHQADIIVLGEHNLFVLTVGGQITFQKRLEYHPAACITYPVPGAKSQGGPENLLVATHTKALLVYRASMLSWAAKCDTQPVALAVADLPGVRGAVVALDDAGLLSVLYLGTEPLLNPVANSAADGKDLDYEAIAREHRQLAQIIRDHGGGGGQRLVEPPDRLVIRAQVPQRLDSVRAGGGSFSGEAPGAPGGDGVDQLSHLGGSGPLGRRLTIRLYLTLQGGGGTMDGVTLSVTAPEPLTVETPEIKLPHVSADASDPTMSALVLATGTGLPQGSSATLVATYTTLLGEPRSQRLDIALPLCAFCQVIPPVKNAEFKVTLTTNRAPPPLNAIFEDAMASAPAGVASSAGGGGGLNASLGGTAGGGGAAGGTGSVLSFQYYGGAADVTILVSKAGGRYRVQSDALDGLWLVAGELASRLRSYFQQAEGGASSSEGAFAVTFDEALPLEEYLEVVEQHFAARQAAAALRTKLEDRAAQFRNVEKRLLMRFKDKSPSPLNQLDMLMHETYDELMALGGSMDEATGALSIASKRLAGATQLLLLLIRWRFSMSDAEWDVLRASLSPQIIDTPEAGWEETTEAALTHLLRTCLARNAKEQAVQVPPLAAAKSTERLRKYLSLVLERLARGMKLAAPGDGMLAALAGMSGVSGRGLGGLGGASMHSDRGAGGSMTAPFSPGGGGVEVVGAGVAALDLGEAGDGVGAYTQLANGGAAYGGYEGEAVQQYDGMGVGMGQYDMGAEEM